MSEYDYSSGWYIGLSHKSIDHQNVGLADWQLDEFILLLLNFIDWLPYGTVTFHSEY